jgi:hypothetical protein
VISGDKNGFMSYDSFLFIGVHVAGSALTGKHRLYDDNGAVNSLGRW